MSEPLYASEVTVYDDLMGIGRIYLRSVSVAMEGKHRITVFTTSDTFDSATIDLTAFSKSMDWS